MGDEMSSHEDHQAIQNELSKIGLFAGDGTVKSRFGNFEHDLLVQPKDSSDTSTMQHSPYSDIMFVKKG